MKTEHTLTCSESILISLVISLDGMVVSRVPNVVSSSTTDIAEVVTGSGKEVGGSMNG